VAPWTGTHGNWAVKLAPFLIPPFRALLVNRQGDFLPGTPRALASHGGRALGDSARNLWNLLRGAGAFLRDTSASAACRFASAFQSLRLALLHVAGKALCAAGYPHCRLFPRLHGAAPLAQADLETEGAGVAAFHNAGALWDAHGLEQLARTTSARWILWHSEPAPADPPPGSLSLFYERNTFAVTPQTHHRGWKPSLFATAPFRVLQPGEASAVLAPLGPSILVDRAMLLALGIPRTALPGTAWRILFWKAAAAGWRSYSIGRVGTSTEEPDRPMEEAAFLLRFLTDRGLRRLGPREPVLTRGAAAFAAPLERPRHAENSHSDRLRVLLVSPFLPYPLSHGGAVRMWNLCRELSPHVDFTLVAVREKDERVDYERLAEVFSQVNVVDLDQHPSSDASLPEQVRQYQSRVLSGVIGETARRTRPHLLQVEYTHMAGFKDAAGAVPAILVEHDVTYSLYRQLALARPGPAAQAEYQRWLRFERHWLQSYEGVWTVSEDDRQAAVAAGERAHGNTWTVPNGVDISRFRPCGPAAGPEILYVGSFRHLPNAIGFHNLLREVMPSVWQRIPEARLTVVGGPRHETHWKAHDPAQALDRLDPRIEVLGFVEDLRPLYARAAVVVVPLGVSAGTNIKVLEAMACGRAVVSTPVGCAGLGLDDGHDAAIRSDWPAFASAVCDLLADPDRRHAIAAAARCTAESRFSWTSIARRADLSYRELAGAAQGPRNERVPLGDGSARWLQKPG
jgi:glycosyltransferase involved in cell wall biosynthesis